MITDGEVGAGDGEGRIDLQRFPEGLGRIRGPKLLEQRHPAVVRPVGVFANAKRRGREGDNGFNAEDAENDGEGAEEDQDEDGTKLHFNGVSASSLITSAPSALKDLA